MEAKWLSKKGKPTRKRVNGTKKESYVAVKKISASDMEKSQEMVDNAQAECISIWKSEDLAVPVQGHARLMEENR